MLSIISPSQGWVRRTVHPQQALFKSFAKDYVRSLRGEIDALTREVFGRGPKVIKQESRRGSRR
jgi:hypothetical protein